MVRLTLKKASRAVIVVATILTVYGIYQYVVEPSSDRERKELMVAIHPEEKHPGAMKYGGHDEHRPRHVPKVIDKLQLGHIPKLKPRPTLKSKPGPTLKSEPMLKPEPRLKHVPRAKPKPQPQQPIKSSRSLQMERSHNRSVARAAELSNLKENCKKHMGHYGYSITNALKTKKGKLGYSLAYVDSHHFIINMVPFSGDNFWKKLVLGVQGYKNPAADRIEKMLNHMSSLDKYGFADRLMSHKKVLLKRNPLKRLIAAYRDAFEGKFVRTEIQEIRTSINDFLKISEDPSKPVTFSEFVSYVSSSLSHPTAERLWGPVAKRTLLCDIEWDYTYCVDNHYEDYRQIRSALRLSQAVNTPRLDHSTIIPDKIVREYFTTVDNDILQRFYTTFELDFKLLDYKMPSLSETRQENGLV
ncbi:carbohydrate sulfotransferase 11-like isoform X2 [Anneissia japonica]|uniref:carbohydrate sulfotransferase 11-like isoform X2 n=1 Tax=Anneissia japonica TaxID=1529436 RepID=UPI0014258F0C|nr:carbohydrate sulfotransferase 11-like isoform X2 [Anneissia japonica]